MNTIEDGYPLSPMQSGMLFQTLYRPGKGLDIEQVVCHIPSSVDLAALKFAWEQIFHTHDVLRTGFDWINRDQPIQRIHPNLNLPWKQLDWSQTPENQQQMLSDFLCQDRLTGFQLDQPPLMRVCTIQTGGSCNWLIWTYHHILLDGRAYSVIFRQLAQAYQAHLQNQPITLVPTRPYRDYITWLGEQNWDEAKTYWQEKMCGVQATALTSVSHIQTPLPANELEFASIRFAFSPEFSTALKQFAEQQSVTVNTVLQGAWAILLNRYNGEPDVVFGTIVTGRHSALNGQGTGEMVGLMINTLPVRVHVSSEITTRQLLQDLRASALELRTSAREHFPLTEIQRNNGIAPGARMFNTILAYERFERRDSVKSLHELFKDWEIEIYGGVGYPLSTRFYAGKEVITYLEYDRTIFDLDTIQRLLSHWKTILEGMIQAPGIPTSRLSILSKAECHQILYEWNNTQVEYPTGQCIHQFFETQVAKTPDAIAIKFENCTLSYNQLNKKANQLAHYLKKMGVGPNTLVGICLERSLEMVIGLYGIIKAGGAYVPIDPTYPSDRLAFLLEDAELKILLTQENQFSTLSSHPFIKANTTLLALDRDWEQIATQPDGNLPPQVTPSDLVYMIYTSGSTGKPKGALNSHAGIFNRLLWMQSAYPLIPSDRVLQKTPFSFDVSVWEFFWPLMFGAQLIIARPEGHKDPQYLVETIQHEGITTLHFVPSMLYSFLDTPGVSACYSLKRVICSGEALPVDLMNRFFSTLRSELHNLYGPTEAAVDVSYWACHPDKTLQSVPIGKPIANTQLYILDNHLQPVPIGISGELYIGGIQVGKGYLNRPELTSEKFIENPYGSGKLYKTGDLARYLPDGNIEYVGRIDYQVKIRGFRIELGEIEAALLEHPAVHTAAVIARAANERQKRLIGYITLQNSTKVSQEEIIAELRTHLKRKLPDYMVPNPLMILEQLPLSPNGKIDRKALPEPNSISFVRSTEYESPRTKVEQILADIWTNLLGVEQVGLHDNFFELGGDSIISLQFISRAQAKGLYLTPRQVFEAQTIEALAQIAQENNPIQAEQGLILGPVPLTPIQRQFFEQHAINPHHYNQCVWVEAPFQLATDILSEAVEYLQMHHDALRLRFKLTPNGWEQSLAGKESIGDNVSRYDLTDLSPQKQKNQMKEISKELQTSLNIDTGPLLRVGCFHMGSNQPDRLVFIIHHLAVDYVSWQIIISDLWTVYSQLAMGQPPKLPVKTSSFKAWAEWLVRYAQHEDLLAELTYWLETGRQVSLPLPVDHPNQKNHNRIADAAQVKVFLHKNETKALLQNVPTVYHTQINDILLTALAQAFRDWTGEESLLIDLEGHGREADNLDISRTVGWFTSIFPVRLNVNAYDSSATIKSIKEQLRLIPQKGLGYGILRYLNTKTKSQLATVPKAEVSFNYGGQLKTVAVQWSGNEWADEDNLGYLFNINAAIIDDKLTVSWLYSQELYERKTVENLANGFILALKKLIEHCLLVQTDSFTPSDFPLANLSQVDLDHLVESKNNLVDLYPLSPMQAGMLFHSIYAPTSGVYYIQTGFQISGRLDVERFKQAWQRVVDRHSILRTSFVWQGLKQPLQMVHRQVELPWDFQDWQDVPPAEQNTRLQQLFQRERQTGFELIKAPLTKYTVIRLEEDRYQFMWHCHHLLTDGWSIPIIFREVFDYYKQPTLSLPPEKPYSDYINWLTQKDQKRAEQFWRERLAGFTAPTSLGVDHIYSEDGHQTARFELSDELTAQLIQFARQHRLTLNTLIQGGYALLLKHYSNQIEVIFGVTVSGRTSELDGIESRVGPFLNTLPLRVSFPDGMAILPWLGRIQQENALQNEYAYSGLTDIQHWSEVPAGTSLFESILVFENYPFDKSAFKAPDGLYLENFKSIEQTNYPLVIVALPQEHFTLNFNFDRSRFDLGTIERMAQHLQILLRNMVANPHQSFDNLPMLSDVETQQLLTEWNNIQTVHPQEKCIQEWFDTQVLKRPDAIAVIFENEQLTYSELDKKANQLANYLRTQGIERETIIALYMDRSLEMIIALLAILKAGGAYLPIDPIYPSERVIFILEDSHTPLLLTQQDKLASITNFHGKTLCLDTQWGLISQQDSNAPEYINQPQDLAYVIYTSGSTGKPKGVLVTHYNVVRLFQATDSWYHFGQDDIWTMFHSYAFDFSVWEIWGALLYGGRVIVVPYLVSRTPETFYKMLIDEGVTILNQTPSAFYQLIQVDENLGRSQDLKLRYVIFGGEALDLQVLRPWFDHHDEQMPQLVNMYGITETTVHVTYRPIRRSDLDTQLGSVIGVPIPDLQVHLLDSYHQLCPIGVTGEIYVGGAGVARGYLNRAELTMERFIENPFGKEKTDRLYKSGDLARRLPNGELVYLGRADFQVKIRGFRVELGEIETILGLHPSVRSALVLAHTKTSGQQSLIAYVVLKNNSSKMRKNIIFDLRNQLKKKLPGYMIPSDFVLLDRFPLTANGKIDRQALPTTSSAQEQSDENHFAAPQTKLEKILVDVWSEVLDVSPIGINDDFFDLGGNSLLSVRLLARIQQLGLHISLRQFLENTTIAKLAAAIPLNIVDVENKNYRAGQKVLLATSSTLLTLQPFGPRLPLFLVHPSGGSALCYVPLSRLLGNDQPSFGLEAAGLYDNQEPDQTIEQMAERYLRVIQKVASKGPYCLAGWSFGGMVAFEMAQRLTKQGDEVNFLGLIDTMLPSPAISINETQEALRLVSWINDFYKTDLALADSDLHQPTPDLQLEHILGKMIKLGLDVSNLEFVVQSRTFITKIRLDKALANYQPQIYPGKIVLFRAKELTEKRKADRLHPDYLDRTWGWDRYSTQSVDIDWIKGSHDVLVEHPYVKSLAKKLRSYLTKTQP